MPTDVDLLKVAASMQALEARFIESRSLGLHLSAEDEAEFKRLAVEAKAMLDSELGHLNDFSSNWAAAGFKDTLLRCSMKREVFYGYEKAIQPGIQV